MRIGATNQELRRLALQQFLMKKFGRSWEDMPCYGASIDDIDPEAIRYFLKKGIKEKRMSPDAENTTPEEVISNLGLMEYGVPCNGAGDVSELRCRIAELENQLESTGQKFADLSTFGRFRRKNRDKLKTADRQLTELQDELDALSEKRDNAQKNFHEFTEKNQEQVRMRLTDAVFARMVVDVRSLLDAMPSELKARVDGEFMTAIAERPNEILKCAMYLFLGYLDGATQFAQSCGGGGTSSDLPWGRKDDEDDRRFAYRCMMQAHKMLKPSQPKRGVSGRR